MKAEIGSAVGVVHRRFVVDRLMLDAYLMFVTGQHVPE